MSSCQNKIKVEKYMDEELPAEDKQFFVRHLETCPVCVAEFESAKKLDALFEFGVFEMPEESYWEETPGIIMNRLALDRPDRNIAKQKKRVWVGFSFPEWTTPRLVAIGGLVALLLFFVLRPQVEERAPGIEVIADSMSKSETVETAKTIKSIELAAPNMPEAAQPVSKSLAKVSEAPLSVQVSAEPQKVTPRGLNTDMAVVEESFLTPAPNNRFLLPEEIVEKADKISPTVSVLSNEAVDGFVKQVDPLKEVDLPDTTSDFLQILWLVQKSPQLSEKRNIWLSYLGRETNVTFRIQAINNLSLVLYKIAVISNDFDQTDEAIRFFEEHEADLRSQMKDVRFEKRLSILRDIMQ